MRSFVTVFQVVALATVSEAGAAELCPNPDFSSELSGWNIAHEKSVSVVTLENDIAPAALRLDNRFSGRNDGAYSDRFPVSSVTGYELAGHVKRIGGDGGEYFTFGGLASLRPYVFE